MSYIVGSGSIATAGLQTSYGTAVTPSSLLNMTSESIAVTANKSDEGNLLLSKTANQRDLTSITVEGSVSTILRPEFADWMFEACLGKKNSDGAYILADPNTDLPVSTLVLGRGGIYKKYADVTARSLSINAAAQDYVKADIDVVGVKEEAAIASDAGSMTSFSKPSYRCTKARLIYGAEGAELDVNFDANQANSYAVESASVSIDNGVEAAPATYQSGIYANRPYFGKRSVTVEFTLPYSEAVEAIRQQYYLSEAAPNMALLLAFTTADKDENIQIYLPHVNITNAPANVGGEGLVETTFTGEALSVGSDEPIVVTVNHKN